MSYCRNTVEQIANFPDQAYFVEPALIRGVNRRLVELEAIYHRLGHPEDRTMCRKKISNMHLWLRNRVAPLVPDDEEI